MTREIVEVARELAARAHADQVRKSGGLPYFSHLEAVAELVQKHGHSEPICVAAAYLHDLLEDRPAFADELRRELPSAVVETVEALSETKLDEQGRRLPKAVRFERYLRGLSERSPVTERALPISCADKVHNVTSVIEAEARGEPLLVRLNTRPGEQLEHLARLRPLYAAVVSPSLLAEFDRVHAELRRTITRWLFGRAVMIAAEAHLSQFDRAGQPYILHPLTLALQAGSEEERIVAVLHDVIEDSPVTLDQLAREGFPRHVIDALEALTKRSDEDYDSFIERVAKSRLATRVKLLDLAHNSDLSRLPSAATDADHARVAKYARAAERLREELERRSLQIRLEPQSAELAGRSARHGVVRGHHVTLARRVSPEAALDAFVPPGMGLGDVVEVHAVAECCDDRVHAYVIELAGSSVRRWDNGVLHLTLSHVDAARARDANELVATAERTPVSIKFRGVLEWVDD